MVFDNKKLTLLQNLLSNLQWYVRRLDSKFWWDFDNFFSKYNFSFAVSIFAFFFNPKRCLFRVFNQIGFPTGAVNSFSQYVAKTRLLIG